MEPMGIKLTLDFDAELGQLDDFEDKATGYAHLRDELCLVIAKRYRAKRAFALVPIADDYSEMLFVKENMVALFQLVSAFLSFHVSRLLLGASRRVK